MKAVKVNKLYLIFSAVLAVAAVITRAVGEELQPNVPMYNNLPSSPGSSVGKGKFYTIEQKLDHFDKSETRTWKMRYIANDEFYKSGGPFFIYVGGEWRIDPISIGPGYHIYDMAKENNGYLFCTEHRYYGESRPVEDLTEKNLQYLSAEQSLADLAHFIRHQKATVAGAENAKVILLGCSYSGALVTWFKKIHPDLVAGCWSSSGPVLAKADFGEYGVIVGQSLKKVAGDACYNHITNGFAELESILDNHGIEVKKNLLICEWFNYENDLDKSSLMQELSGAVNNLILTYQFDKLREVCKIIMAEPKDVYGLGKFAVQSFLHGKCTEFSYGVHLSMYKDSFYFNNTMRPWLYQTCNELGWFATTNAINHPFGTKYPLSYYATLCRDALGEKFTEGFIEKQTQKTNKMFGGLNPGVKNVYWTHGELDPWRGVGIQSGNMATILPNHTHCSDLSSISHLDSPELKASKEKIAVLVKEWLAK